jgi:hypothetical protein
VDVAARERRARLLERAEQQLVGVRREHVVAVHEREVLPLGVVGARVAGRAEAAVRARDEPEAAVLALPLARDVPAAVGRAVVDHQDLEVGDRLLGQRGQARIEEVLDVVDRDDDADPRHRSHLMSGRAGA